MAQKCITHIKKAHLEQGKLVIHNWCFSCFGPALTHAQNM